MTSWFTAVPLRRTRLWTAWRVSARIAGRRAWRAPHKVTAAAAIRAARAPPVGLAVYSPEKRSNDGNTNLRQRQANVRNHAVGNSHRKRLIVDRRARI